ncbi:huntingtin-associated protein 1 isoform X2 [Manis pentadactyla]|uniref:huntingtin-associated protein 1 isoform X2 n=1 Tax=Manis pentadactyla TaxID=143292 RepID=UPI00255CDBFC|nr:huntingtin-associated protein 1 isoform X2 [Manis pentadactyla]
MRPKESGRACAGTPPGPGHPAAVTPTPPPAADPAPKPSAEPEPAPAQPPATGQGAGSGSSSVSRPPARARRASEPGSEAGVQRASAFWGRTAQSVHRNSDAPWTRFIFQGRFGPRATGLGIGKAAGIWKTPAAYIGRRPGESGPERAAFIRELGEALCPDRPLPAKKVTQEDVKVMLNLLEERERDLSTAARIGQSLVKQNSVLMEENSELEAMLGSAGEEILQLRQQVSLRDDLLQLYSDSDEEEEEEEEAEEEEEEEEEEHQYGRPYEPPEPSPLTEVKSGHHCPQLGALQEQLRLLKEENHQLREASHLDALEEEEQMLILDCVEQFSEASQQMAELSEVLALRMENHDRQQREVTQLRTQVLKLQQRCQLYGAETKKLQQQLASEKEIQMQLQDEPRLPGPPGESRHGSLLGMPGSQQKLWAGSQLQDLRAKYTECGGMLIEAQEEVKTLRQQAPVSSGSVTHCAYTVPLETLAEELRMSIRRIISDPVFFMERNCERTTEEVSGLGCELHHSEEQEQEQGIEAEKGLMPAEDFVVEDFMPEEELWATEEVVLAEEGVTEEAELVSEEAEAWEEVEPEVDEATRTHVVASALEAGGLGSSHLDMKYVLQQLANWQDTHYRQQLRQKTLQKGSPTMQPWQQQARTNMGGRGVEQQPWVPTRDFQRLEEDRAREEEGPSGATQAFGTKASTSKGHSWTSPLGFAVSQQPAEAPPTPDPPSHPPTWDPLSVPSPPSVLMNLGQSLRAQGSTLFWDRLKEPAVLLQLVQKLWLLGLDHVVALGAQEAQGEAH